LEIFYLGDNTMEKLTKQQIGQLIGRSRKYRLKYKSNDYNQKNFMIYKGFPICSQSTLSRIENGNDFTYDEVIEVLINKLGYNFSNNQEDYDELLKLADNYVELLMYKNNNQLNFFEKEYDFFHRKHQNNFYISHCLEILNMSLKYYIHSEIPNIDKIEELIFYFPNQSNTFNLILKDIVVWFLEISPFNSASISKFLLKNLALDDSNILNSIINKNITIRTGDFIKSLRILDKIQLDNLNILTKFRVKRLYLLVHINILRSFTAFEVDNFDFILNLNEIPKFELAKLYHLLGIIYMYKNDYEKAFDYFNLSHTIYEPISVISMQFMVEIYRKNHSFDLKLFLNKVNKYIKAYPVYFKNQFRLFEIIYIEEDYHKGIKFIEKNLTADLKNIKQRNLLFSIFENQLIELVSKTNTYKSLYDFYISTHE